MEAESLISKIKSPETLVASDESLLNEVIEKFPYFQAAQSLHLKLLKQEESFEFKKYLRTAALHTTNRSLLFDFINRNIKEQQNNAQKISKLEKAYNSVSENDAIKENKEIIEKNSASLSTEKHSFTQWLNLTKVKPLDHNNIEKEHASEEIQPTKEELIEKFIKNNPKIPKSAQVSVSPTNIVKTAPSQQMMTETLAKIYIEQKKYDKAIEAYNILILNNPKKSSFFADQIKKIESLQENK